MVNKVVLIGNVGKDPETKNFEGGTQLSKFTLATTKHYKKDGEKTDDTQWHNIVVWRGLSKVVESYVKKGDKLYIEGEIQYRTYDDKEGNKRYVTEIQATEMKMLGKTSKGVERQHHNAQVDGNHENAYNDSVLENDDYPF